jgi:hypothetical protein
MKVVMDSDCLIKLSKAGAKEAVVSAMEISIPPLVKKETVDEAKASGCHDAFIIEENISHRSLRVVSLKNKKSPFLTAAKGEMEVVSLFSQGNYDAVASDDKRFLKKLNAAGIPYLTPAACIIYLHQSGKAEKMEAARMLEALKPFISREEYAVAMLYLEKQS